MYILFFIIQAIYKNNSSQNKCPVKLNFTGHLISYHSSAEREAPEPTLSENIIKLQITDNHILSTMKSKSKSF